MVFSQQLMQQKKYQFSQIAKCQLAIFFNFEDIYLQIAYMLAKANDLVNIVSV